MIILGVGIGVLLVVSVGLAVARKVNGDSRNFLVAGRSLALPLSAAGLIGQAVDSNAALGNTDLSYTFGFRSPRVTSDDLQHLHPADRKPRRRRIPL